jgi:hypothetical protein
MKPQIKCHATLIVLLLAAIGTAARADSSSVTTIGDRTVECHSASSSSVSASNGTWTLKVDGRDFVIDSGTFSWSASSKDLPKDWKRIEITSADGKATIKVDGADFVEIKD